MTFINYNIISPSNISGLKTVNKNKFTQSNVLGYYSPGDGGGGIYYLDINDNSSVDNGGTIIVANDGGRWKLVITSDAVSAKQFGAKIDGITDDSTIINNAKSALDAIGKRLYLPPGNCFISTAITPPIAGVFGDSPQTSIIICNGCSAFTFPYNFGLTRQACVIEKLGVKSYNNTCDSLFAFNAPGVANNAAIVYNSGLTIRDIEIGTGGRFGGGFSFKDFFRINVENIGLSDVSQVVNLSGSVVQSVFRNVTANGDNAPTTLARNGFSLSSATYNTGSLGPEHISFYDCSGIRFDTGVIVNAGLMINFENMDLETFSYGYFVGQPCTIRGGIVNPAPASAGTNSWIGVFRNVTGFEVSAAVFIEDLEINTLNIPGTPGSSYGIIVGNGVNKSVGTTIKSCRFKGISSSLLKAIEFRGLGGDIIIEDCVIDGSITTGTTVDVLTPGYARVTGNRCATGGTINGTLSIGNNGTGSIGNIAGNEFATTNNTLNAYSGSWAPGSINNLTMANTTVSVPGAVAGDKVVVGLSSLIGSANCIISGYVSTSNNVTVILLNVSGGSVSIPSGTLNVSILK